MLEAVTIVAVLGALFGLILAFAGKKFAVDVDPRIDIIAELLPGANCGACGYPGCHALAEAIVTGETGITPCVGCTTEVKQKIAEVLGLTKEIPVSSAVPSRQSPWAAMVYQFLIILNALVVVSVLLNAHKKFFI